MTRPFSPRDALRLRRLQAAGVSLEIEDALLVCKSPLRQAMTDWRPLGPGAIDTLVAPPPETGAFGGFIQSRRRCAPAEADLTFIAPAFTQANGAALSWGRLITDACQWLGSRGVERVHAAISEDDQVALQVFRHCGFTVGTSDVVLTRPADATAPSGDELRAEPLSAAHELAVRRLAHEWLPDAVRATSDELGGDWLCYPLGGYESGPSLARVWLDESGAVQGAWRIVGGRSAHWLQVIVRPGLEAGPAVRAALADLASDRRFLPAPLFASARGYESALNLALRECGFEPSVRRFRLVKHLAVRVMAPAWDKGVARERGLDPATSSSIKLSAARSSGEPPID